MRWQRRILIKLRNGIAAYKHGFASIRELDIISELVT
jgi:hypothetical protein